MTGRGLSHCSPAAARAQAREKEWTLREVDGDDRMLRMMVDGTWNETEFLVLKPGEVIAPDYTGLKLCAVRDE